MQLINEKNKMAQKTLVAKTAHKNLKTLLTTATCALLGSQAVQAENVKEEAWQFDTALMYYGETDRVTAAEAIFAAKKTFKNDEQLNLKLTIDALTGASANGAIAQPTVETYTRPSGKGQYDVAANETPLDDTFRDTRVQFTGQWTQPLAENYTISAGGNLSKEYDYLSLSVNANLARDFNQKNTTVSAGFAFSQDTITPEGGIPDGLSTVVNQILNPDDACTNKCTNDDNKTIVDLLFGVTQVINKRMITQFNYSYSQADGYMTDPFKMVSLVNDRGITQRNIYESRPDSRAKHSFYGQAKYHFDNSVVDASYRYMTDDWEIDSHTIDTRLRYFLADGSYLEPHFRYYTQSAADFYQTYLMEGQTTPEFVSADYRIGEMDAYTVGLKYGFKLDQGNDVAVRLEYYKQTPKSSGQEAFGDIQGIDLFEELDAIILQVSYSF